MTLIYAASVFRATGLVIAAIVIVGFIVYAVINVRAGRHEVGSEIELAANRKPYYSDEELEGPRLDRALSMGLITLTIVGLGLPLYWLAEPGRMANSEAGFDRKAASRGLVLFEEGAKCVTCHGPSGSGGATNFTILDEKDSSFVAAVQWQAPALNTVLLRYTKDEVKFIIDYGRPFSPMPAWGVNGKGPLTEQQISNLVEYLESIQITSKESQAAVAEELETQLGHKPDFVTPTGLKETGKALFNLGRESKFAGGAYSCGRCHTQGWSYSSDENAPADRVDVADGSGAFGPNLTQGDTLRQFPNPEDHIEFVTLGSVIGEKYGRAGQGRGMMPGFGDNPNTDTENDGMLTADMIRAIIEYERSL